MFAYLLLPKELDKKRVFKVAFKRGQRELAHYAKRSNQKVLKACEVRETAVY